MISIKRALLSVYDKEALPEFASALSNMGVELVSSGGTAALLREHGLEVAEVGDLTGYPEMLGGRVKTLHPKIFGGILYRRGLAEDVAKVEENQILPIDMVVVNFYPFERAAAAGGSMSESEMFGLIDIGGPSMVRAAAKNCTDVVVVTDKELYPEIVGRLKEDGGIDTDFSRELAAEAFRRTCMYDLMISGEMQRRARVGFPLFYVKGFRRKAELRYGENPHQKAALYVDTADSAGLAAADPLHGKALSFNNMLDLQSAWDAVSEHKAPSCVVVKHRNPCGVATGKEAADAFTRARDGDNLSAFGGVVAFNCEVDDKTAEGLAGMFLECIIAPGFKPDAFERLSKKKNLRLLQVEPGGEARSVGYPMSGGLLLEDWDGPGGELDLALKTKRAATKAEEADLRFAWAVAKHVTSNAVILARGGVTVGIGSGQTSRIDALNVAIMKAERAGADIKGAVMASDGFFPFRDCVDRAQEVGVSAIVQPGGSVRDQESIDAADEHGIAMVFTGRRCFKH